MNSMTDIERLLHEHACARLCIEFAHFIDAREHERFLDLFTDDGVLDRLGEVFDGKAAIADMLAARSPQLFTRHLCTDIVVDVHSDTHASDSRASQASGARERFVRRHSVPLRVW